MDVIPCAKRTFPYQLNMLTMYTGYLRWLKYLGDRIGVENTLSLWRETFHRYDDAYLVKVLSSGWHQAAAAEASRMEEKLDEQVGVVFPHAWQGMSKADIKSIIDNTPPIAQIKRLFAKNTMEKEINAYDTLHIRFDGMACLAENIIRKYGKQGELIVYDMVTQDRLAPVKNMAGSIEEFMENFIAKPSTPSLFSAGLQTEIICQSPREAVLHVHECEWARYFQSQHPQVGYLMACSTDEVSYRAFNPNLRMQRTQTLMEGGNLCDFRLFAVDEDGTDQNSGI